VRGGTVSLVGTSSFGWLALHGGAGWLADHATAREVLGAATTLVVVPTAAAFEGPDAAIASAVDWFTPLGVDVRACRILSRHDANDPARLTELNAADALLFTGGQPLHLRSVLTDSLAWAAIVAAFERGVTIIAEGAAASAFGDPMLDPRGGAFTIGLGLVTGLAVLPESDTWSADRRARTMRLAANADLALVPSTTTLVRSPTGEWSSRGPSVVTFVPARSTS
jgi:cyanophycinase